MAQTAKDGGLDSFTSHLNSAGSDAEKVELLLKRGRRSASKIRGIAYHSSWMTRRSVSFE